MNVTELKRRLVEIRLRKKLDAIRLRKSEAQDKTILAQQAFGKMYRLMRSAMRTLARGRYNKEGIWVEGMISPEEWKKYGKEVMDEAMSYAWECFVYVFQPWMAGEGKEKRLREVCFRAAMRGLRRSLERHQRWSSVGGVWGKGRRPERLMPKRYLACSQSPEGMSDDDDVAYATEDDALRMREAREMLAEPEPAITLTPAEALAVCRKALPSKWWMTVIHLAKGMSSSDVAAKRGVNPSTICRARKEIADYLRDIVANQDLPSMAGEERAERGEDRVYTIGQALEYIVAGLEVVFSTQRIPHGWACPVYQTSRGPVALGEVPASIGKLYEQWWAEKHPVANPGVDRQHTLGGWMAERTAFMPVPSMEKAPEDKRPDKPPAKSVRKAQRKRLLARALLIPESRLAPKPVKARRSSYDAAQACWTVPEAVAGAQWSIWQQAMERRSQRP